MLAEVAKPEVQPILLAEIQTASDTTRAWTGYGDLARDGETWVGTGLLGTVSPVTETTDLFAHGLTYTLSGVPEEMISLALGDIRQGLPCKLWLGMLEIAGRKGTLLADPYLLFSGLSDVPEISEDGETCTISITAENRLIRLERARERRYTPEDQKRIDPTDKGCEFVAFLQDAEIRWGRS